MKKISKLLKSITFLLEYTYLELDIKFFGKSLK